MHTIAAALPVEEPKRDNRTVTDGFRNVVYAQVSFFGFLAAATLITGEGFRDNHGPSYYGEHVRTLVPYGLGLLLCAFFVWRAAAELDGRLARGLRILAVLLVLDLATPDTVDSAFYWSHVVVSVLLFLQELAIGVELVAAAPAWPRVGLFAVQFGAGLVAMFSQLHVIGALSFGIVAYQLAFGLLLVVATHDLPAPAAALAEGT